MGIFINLTIAKSTTKKEWEDVYEETMELIKKLPLAERACVDIHGVSTVCLVKSQEHEFPTRWQTKNKKIGWAADGDMDTLETAEQYFLPRNLIGENNVYAQAGDAMLGALPSYLNCDDDDERMQDIYYIWGSKTQGESYHIYLLAVACLIQDRLGSKAFIYGDITRGQCKKAVEIANTFLEKKIDMPDRCYSDRLMKRINNLNFSEEEKIDIFNVFFLGTKGADFGEELKHNFSEESLNNHWKQQFANSKIGTVGFNKLISEYLLWGFEIDALCNYVKFEDDNGNMHYEEFINRIMDAKLHLKDKNCADPLKIDQEQERPYSIWTLFAQFGFSGAQNKKVDRYVPIEVIRKALRKGLSGKLDVDLIIDEYLKREADQMEINLKEENVTKEQVHQAAKQDVAETFRQLMDRERMKLSETYAKYDINELEDLMLYESGDKICPDLEESLGRSRKFLDEILNEVMFKELCSKPASEKYRWIIDQNRYILIRDSDWKQVYRNLEEKPESFARYYSLMRVNSGKNNIYKMTRALMINDDLYNYTKKLAENIKEEG